MDYYTLAKIILCATPLVAVMIGSSIYTIKEKGLTYFLESLLSLLIGILVVLSFCYSVYLIVTYEF